MPLPLRQHEVQSGTDVCAGGAFVAKRECYSSETGRYPPDRKPSSRGSWAKVQIIHAVPAGTRREVLSP